MNKLFQQQKQRKVKTFSSIQHKRSTMTSQQHEQIHHSVNKNIYTNVFFRYDMRVVYRSKTTDKLQEGPKILLQQS